MASFILIGLCFSLGAFFRSKQVFPENAAQVLNRFVLYISLPALTLSQIYQLQIDKSQILVPISMPWLQFIFSFIFFSLMGKWLKWNSKTTGAIILTAGLGNTSFVGFPLLEALFGKESLGVGILVDQPGSFLVMSTLAVAAASYCGGQSVKIKTFTKRLLYFPPFLALIVAFFLRQITVDQVFLNVLDTLAATVIPLALIAVGLQLKLHPSVLKTHWRTLSLGLGFKLFLIPLVFTAIYLGLIGRFDQVTYITLVEASMAPMITAGIIAQEYDLDLEVGNLMVGVGILVSLLTVPLWFLGLAGYFN